MADNDVKKGFNTTLGIILALCFVFIILPLGTCAGCMFLGAGTAVVGEGARQAEIQQQGPEIEIKDIAFTINTANQFMHKASYKFTVKNNRDRQLRKSFEVKFQDKNGLTVSEDLVLSKAIPAGAEIVIDGMDTMMPEESGNVESILVVER